MKRQPSVLDDTTFLSEVYSVKEDAMLMLNEIAILGENGTVLHETPSDIWERRRNLGQVNIRATLITSPPVLFAPRKAPQFSFGHQV